MPGPYIQHCLIHGTVILSAATSVALLVLGMALVPTVSRLIDLRSEAMLLGHGELFLPEVRHKLSCKGVVVQGKGRAWASLGP